MSEESDRLDGLILNCQVLRAVRLIMELFECGLREAIGLFDARYHELRETRPDDFIVSPDEYGHGVYT
ncbi:hypothetical protein SAMN04489712_106291 [Thermomonospora echinospora]|uniref:Uncharacterized protein n=1 Tax=Thermomonospora echinospora TaxID=1992 RepID=A0A1H6B7I5_9ACTN|nr:hypothetical protein [Thermomonospora echinospora]SEG56177.1 hypothetical protein SAMN04489712_106291 [Thermomonospora echinospora]